jgi:ubiquinone/menaquinone biosynthesis C-methylase UbiE
MAMMLNGEVQGEDSALGPEKEARIGKESPLSPEILKHYAGSDESVRLERGRGLLERVRTLLLLERYLPHPPARVADVGGGAGAYAIPLAARGYEVHLVDPVPVHVQQASQGSTDGRDKSVTGIAIADARRLPFADATMDAVLALGPLYHLPDRDDRITALLETSRVLRDDGVLFAAAISRFASTYDGLFNVYLEDELFQQIVERDVRDGQHRNPTNYPAYFTTAYFHLPDEFVHEIGDAGLSVDDLFAVEGPASWLPEIQPWLEDARRRDILLRAIERVETEPSILGASAHLLAVARRR